MSRANESAYPIQASDLTGSLEPQHGLTIREHFAAMALASLSSHHTQGDHTMHEVAAKQAVRFADALIAELAKVTP